MLAPQLPLVVLAGGDRRPATMPAAARDHHPLAGYKGAAVRVGGRPLVVELLDRLRESGRFGPLYVAGPAEVYRTLGLDAQILDTDASFGGNIRAALEALRQHHPGSAAAFITCDVLPSPAALRRLMALYDLSAPCDMWFPLVRTPSRDEALGASAWKPVYAIVPERGRSPVGILPGHLVVVDPSALRREFLYRMFDLGYSTRNRPIDSRRGVMVRGLILEMLYRDLLHVLSLRRPTLTWSVLRAALPAANLLREGTITVAGLERALRKILVRYRHRRSWPQRRVVIPLVDELSLARDIDTVEEARELGGEWVNPDAGLGPA